MKVIEQRGGKRVYDFTKTEERPPDETRQREQHIIDAAVAVVLDQVPPQQLSATRDLIAQAMEILDLQIAAIRHDLGEGGFTENARWWAKATAAQRIKGKTRVRLQTKLGEIHRLIRLENKRKADAESRTRDSRFIQLAKKHLADAVWQELWRQVNEEFDGAGHADEV
jgi:hypothetical protein